MFINHKSQNFIASTIDFHGIDDKIPWRRLSEASSAKINQYDMICVDLAE